jgi:putative transposase
MTTEKEHTGHRRSIRLQNYDYARGGWYFVTICVNERCCLFGNITDDVMRLNDAGAMTHRWFIESENKFSNLQCDAFVCMPNHVHFIVANTGKPEHQQTAGADLCVRPSPFESSSESLHKNEHTDSAQQGEHTGSPLQKIVQWYKTMTTNEYIRRVKKDNWPKFRGRLWQRNYWEHVIRSEQELCEIREYIRNNPARWATDYLYIPIR